MLGPFVASMVPRKSLATNIMANDVAAPVQIMAIDQGMKPMAISRTRCHRSASQPKGITDRVATTEYAAVRRPSWLSLTSNAILMSSNTVARIVRSAASIAPTPIRM